MESAEVYLWTMVVLYSLNILIYLYRFFNDEYPRTRIESSFEAALGIVIAAGFLVWSLFILF